MIQLDGEGDNREPSGDEQGGVWKSAAHCGWFWWLIVSVSLVGASLLLQFEPPDRIAIPVLNSELPQSCWTRRWLGLDCPGCGLTRSFVLAAKGRVAEAFEMHPVGTLMFGLLVLQIPLRLAQGYQFLVERASSSTLPKANEPNFGNLLSSGKLALAILSVATGISFLRWAWQLFSG